MSGGLWAAWAGVVVLLLCIGTMLLTRADRVSRWVFLGVILGSAVGLQLLLFGSIQVARG